ncbi:ATP-dependent helicase/nuclease subunit B [Parvibaculum indicum]|uniref:double-strand break repair protein AddB n=1 Tax=Parvibaculum indicum TaxID=562969 RepID=UPI00141E163A|nr:double-strand break repair protein AddB [Parvibaculum indicum]NIJ43131.1 ATP-dependent helicase/nuclease subunit B [Parvibaculum indicum]
MAADSLHLFTVPSGQPFLSRLAEALRADPSLGGRFAMADGRVPELPDLTILLPTRRAARALGDAFLRAGEGEALLLPVIRPLGDVDEDGIILDPGGLSAEMLALPPAMPPLERQMRLARFILAHEAGSAREKGREGITPDAPRALALAAELGQFLDMAITERVALKNLADLVPDTYAENWQITVDFLKVLTAHWPEEMKRLGFMEQAERRNRLLEAEAKHWRDNPPEGPVIAAGSTGSIPATADLLAVVSRLPNGAVVLPGLDLALDEASWATLGGPGTASHPQYGMKKLIDRLQATRADVDFWPGAEPVGAMEARIAFLSETMRPAETTERWRESLAGLRPRAGEAVKGLRLVEASAERDEAAAIALMMREALEVPGKTAAMVSPDRNLARRVAMELRRWGIEIDDSAGAPLGKAPPVGFMRLIAEAVAEELAPVPLLAMLKHPMAALSRAPYVLRDETRRLERMLLRGPRPAPGLDGLRAALVEERDRRREAGRSVADFEGLDRLIDDLDLALEPMVEAMARGEADPAYLAEMHIRVAEALAATDTEKGAGRLWIKETGEASAAFLEDLLEAAPKLGPIPPASWPRLFAELADARNLRPRFGRHPRLFIWGPMEARLQHADLMILGSLNEGTWPGEANIDPWLNRPMRAALGLEPPEQRIGLAAHDFVEAASAGETVLTRAEKQEGAPTVASRWWLRLTSVVEALGVKDGLHDRRWARWADELDEAKETIAIPKPRPAPPLKARPRQFSVTEIETLIRDPYAIYARKVLRLSPLDPLDADVAAAERGMVIHKALERFTKEWPKGLPPNPLEEMLRIGAEVFAHLMDRPGVRAFWWPRFQRIAAWMVEYEQAERQEIRRSHAELSGEIELDELATPVRLTGRADRIDERDDGTLVVTDYKTGALPSRNQVEAGLAPQLPLEAEMAARGGFRYRDAKGREVPLPAANTSRLVYVRLTGGENAGEVRAITDAGSELANATYDALVDLLTQYENEATPYLSRPRPMFIGRFGDYDHLARVPEWSAGDGE